MSKSTARTDKMGNLTTAAMSFVGVLAAAPLALSLYGSPANVAATADTPGASQTLSAEDSYAQYAYAYTQGYLANQTNGAVEVGCTEGSTSASAEAKTENGAPQTLGAHTQVGGHGSGSGSGSSGAVAGTSSEKMVPKKQWVKNIHNSYKSYNSASTTVHNTNSNNVVGSHNYMKTEVDVEDSKGVYVGGTSNTSTNIGLSHSLNHDSYNTKNTAINNSFNEEKNIHSGNTTTTNTEIKADVELAHNSHNTTNTNSHNESNVEVKTELEKNIDNSVNNSYNSDDDIVVKDNEVEVEVE